MDFQNKVVLITGSSAGIGAGTAELFAKLGATLVLTGRNEVNLKKVAEKCTVAGAPKPLTIVADVSVDDDVKRIIDTTIKTFKKLDVLVNNAGHLEIGSIEFEHVLQQYDTVMAANIRSVVHLTHLAAPYLISSKGAIVNVSSINGMRAFPDAIAYNVSKAAMDHFTKCVALELAPKGVRVNSVNPGVIITEVHKRSGMSDETYERFLENSRQAHALGRVGEVKEVADAIAFLASDKSSFITGLLLPIDGGRHAMCPYPPL